MKKRTKPSVHYSARTPTPSSSKKERKTFCPLKASLGDNRELEKEEKT